MYYQTQILSEAVDFTALSKRFPEFYPASLISTAHDDKNGRYDILCAYPQQTIKLDHNSALSIDGEPVNSSFLSALDTYWKKEKQAQSGDSDALPFTGGWFIFLSYEFAGEIEPSLQLSRPSTTLPMALAKRCPAAIIFDHKYKKTHLLVENDYQYLANEINADIASIQHDQHINTPVIAHSIVESDVRPYLSQLDRIKNYIKEGDIFQANLSRLWKVKIGNCSIASLFSNLAKSNPGCFAAYVQLDEQTIISSSPERLVSVKNNIIQTRPIAGTRPRAHAEKDDKNLSAELLAHPKEKAEHIMLIDLERNDLGRLCIPGSIEVDELMVLETYQHVHHIVSNVRGNLRADATPGDVIRAVFPGGTITGCPKVRCMQILSDMEKEARGAYTGSLGYINCDGNMDLNILIRTMVHEGDHVNFRAGGGIVADSDPESELEETRAKAKGLLKAFDSHA